MENVTINKNDLLKVIENLSNGESESLKERIESKIGELLNDFRSDNEDFLDTWLEYESISLDNFYNIRVNVQMEIFDRIKKDYLCFDDIENYIDEYQSFERSFFRTKNKLNLLNEVLN